MAKYEFIIDNSKNSHSFLNSIQCKNNVDNGLNNQWDNEYYGNYWSGYIVLNT